MKPTLWSKVGVGIASLLVATSAFAQQDVTQPGDPIIPSSSNSPGSEGVANAIDGQQTKYLNFDSGRDGTNNRFSPSGFVVSPSIGVTHVTGLRFMTANDAPVRDPKIMTLEGSNDAAITGFNAGTWELITTITAEETAVRYATQTFEFANNKPYRHYRWIVTETAGMGAENTCCMQVAEVELLGRALPSDVTQPTDAIIASSANSPGSEGVKNAIDGQQTKYLNFDSGRDGANNRFSPSGFVVTPAIGSTVVSGMTMMTANDAPVRDPKIVVIEGSNDAAVTSFSAGNWEAITTLDIPEIAERYVTRTFLFDNYKPFKHYRFTVNETAGMGAENTCCMQVAEIELLGTGAPTDVTQPTDPILASSANSPGSEGVKNAIDNQQTKYLNFDSGRDGANNRFSPSGFVVSPAIGASVVTGMSIQTANDAPVRDPKIVLLEGSNDDTIASFSSGTWETITTLDIPEIAERYVTREFYFANKKSYKHYRWTVNETAGMGAENTCCMQVAEVQLLAVTDKAPDFARFISYPMDTPALAGSSATFIAELNGPWPVRWYVNGNLIPGANQATYTTPAVTAQNTTNIYTVEILGRETSPGVRAVLFAPSATKSFGINFVGGGANGAPSELAETDVAGFHQQAYWNNFTGGNGDSLSVGDGALTNSSNGVEASMWVTWDSSGDWGSGTGEGTPDRRMLNGILALRDARATDGANPANITFNGIPAGNHSLIVYTVQVPREYWNMDFTLTTFNAAGAEVTQKRYIRPMNGDEYNATPGYVIVTATTPEARSVGNMLRFDNVSPGPDGTIKLSFLSPGWTSAAPGSEPIRGPGVNGVQLLLNPPAAGSAATITSHPVSANAVAGGGLELTVAATGTGLSYQWFKDNQPIPGATGAKYVIGAADADDAGRYTVAVSNAAGRVVSNGAIVEVVQTTNISEGMVVHLKFDETSGTSAANSVTGGQAGALTGFNASASVAGKIGRALPFDGATTFVRVPDYTETTGSLTVSAWVKPSAADDGSVNWGPIVNAWLEGRPIGAKGQFYLEGAGGIDINTGEANAAVRGAIGSAQLVPIAAATIDDSVDQWVHVALTADGGAASLYINGQFVGRNEYSGAINSNDTAFESLVVGAELIDRIDDDGDPATPLVTVTPQLDPATPVVFRGAIDDVAVWNRSLSAPEIASVFAAGNAGKSAAEAAPVLSDDPITVLNPTVGISQTGGQVVITFANGTLESSATANGTYAPVQGATSPYTVPTTGPMQFFRVRGN